MNLDRLETLAAIDFIEKAIPKKSDTGKNCLFVRVNEGKLVLTGGGEFVYKKAVLIRSEDHESSGDEKTLPKTFMIPRADLLAFQKMMKEHKSDCVKLAKSDPKYLYVEITGTELISHDGKIVYQQPIFSYKDLETVFQITKAPISGVPVISGDISDAVFGFMKSSPIEISFTGQKGPVHFGQGDFEAILLPPIEKKDKQTEFDDFSDDNQAKE